jgi:protoporphyrinogen oxidase
MTVFNAAARRRFSTDFVILGAGLTGLAAATRLGRDAVVLEADARPGGLVRTERFGEYWFDRVSHLLFFPNQEVEADIRGRLGDVLAPCPPSAWVTTHGGVARFPLQHHLGHLRADVVERCLRDFPRTRPVAAPRDYRESLLQGFGASLCDVFLLPYNRKMWRRPLERLSPEGFQWNISRPDFEQVQRGAVQPDRPFQAYNGAGWYPRPGPGASLRGMETVSAALAADVPDLRLAHRVTAVDLEHRRLRYRCGANERELSWRERCVSTIPLPALVALCGDAVPARLKRACAALPANRVVSVALSVRGERPALGHWRYYADESLLFTRILFLHEFDPLMAPAEGWPLLAEIPQPAGQRRPDPRRLVARVCRDARRAGALTADAQVVDAHVMLADPAYVVFAHGIAATVAAARGFLAEHGIETVGRYGRWEYSSMGQNLRDGFAAARALLAGGRMVATRRGAR